MGSDDQKTLCRVCGRRPVNSREHIPPQAVGNRGVIELRFLLGAPNGTDARYVSETSRDGFWLPALCDECNSKVGSRCGAAYADFVDQVSNAAGLADSSGRFLTRLTGVYPARIAKQMYCMFLAASPFEPTGRWRGIQDFVRKRDARLPDDAPSVYMYRNVSRLGRITPVCGIVEFSSHEHQVAAEVSWPPVGLVFSFGHHKRVDAMQNVTRWASFAFHQTADCDLVLPDLEVATSYPLAFGTEEDVERQQAQRGLAYLYHVPEGYEGPAGLGTTVRAAPA